MNARLISRLKALLIGLVAAKILITLFYLADVFSFHDFLFFGRTAVAEEKSPPEKEDTKEEPPPEVQKNPAPVLDLKAELNGLEEKRRRIQKESAQLEKNRGHLESLKQAIEVKIEELSEIQRKIEEGLAQKKDKETQEERRRKDAEEAKIKQLVKVYTSMKPKTAAALIDKLDMDVILKLFSRMKGEQIGKILSYVNTTRAAKISERLAPAGDTGK